MKIIEVDENKTRNVAIVQRRLSWSDKFRRNLYNANYLEIQKNQKESHKDQLIKEDTRNTGAMLLVNNILASKGKVMTYQQKKQFYDPQTTQSCYSAYSQYIPLSDQSHLQDEIIQTFPFIQYLQNTNKHTELEKCYQDIHQYFAQAKRKGMDYVILQWKKLLKKYIFAVDSIEALTLYLQVTRSNSQKFQQFRQNYGNQCLKDVMLYRICRAAMYIRKNQKVNRNMKISIQVGEQINQKTLPLVMKTWFCAICLDYDCQKHKLQGKCEQNAYQYVSVKNKKTEADQITSIIRLLEFNQNIKLQNSSRMQEQQSENNRNKINQQNKKKVCSQNCYLKLTKKQILGLKLGRHKLISPLAKSLLSMGIQMFSYNPCMIQSLFQSKFEKNPKNMITCSLIFVHLVEEYNLIGLINEKLQKSEVEHLISESTEQEILPMPTGPSFTARNFKKPVYFDKRVNNPHPEHAICMHSFINKPTIDSRCLQCVCKQRGFCLPSCLCTQYCELKRVGCVCKGSENCQTDKCICFANKLECQPGICYDCFNSRHYIKKNSCNNDQILRNLQSRIMVGISNIPGAGLGAFATEAIQKNAIICRYSGQHINFDIDHIREAMIKDLSFYNFDSPNGKSFNASIDARFMGNKARFINHGNDGQQNLRAQNVFSNGTQYIALYALRDIQEGQELTFNYDGNGQLYKLHRDKYPFIKPPKHIKP